MPARAPGPSISIEGRIVERGALPRRASAGELRRRRLLRASHRGDRHAEACLVEAYLPLVRTIATRYRGNGLPLDDLIQEGAIGLLDAITHYDTARGSRFEPFARFRIRRAIRSALTEQARLIRLPKHVVERQRAVRHAESALLARGAAVTPESIAAETGLPVHVVRLERALPRASVSLDAVDGVDGPALTNALLDPAAPDPAEALGDERVGLLGSRLAQLPPRQRHVVAGIWGLGGREPLPASTMAGELGLSPRRTQSIAQAALDALRRDAGGAGRSASS